MIWVLLLLMGLRRLRSDLSLLVYGNVVAMVLTVLSVYGFGSAVCCACWLWWFGYVFLLVP